MRETEYKTEFKQHYDRQRAQGLHRRCYWLDEAAIVELNELVGRYGRNYSEVVTEAIHRLYQHAQKNRETAGA